MVQKRINVDNLEINSKGEIVKKPRRIIKHSKDNALFPEEQKELIRAIDKMKQKEETKYRYLVMIHLLMDAGLRISEALQVRLDWFQISEDRVILNIPQKARDLSNLKRDWIPKTKAGAREVIFVHKGVGEKVRSFFIQNKGIGFNRQRAYQVVKELGSIINKPNLHPHALRSTYANNLIHAGVNANALCYSMGWSDMNTAINYINTSKVHARDEILKKMTDKEGGF